MHTYINSNTSTDTLIYFAEQQQQQQSQNIVSVYKPDDAFIIGINGIERYSVSCANALMLFCIDTINFSLTRSRSFPFSRSNVFRYFCTIDGLSLYSNVVVLFLSLTEMCLRTVKWKQCVVEFSQVYSHTHTHTHTYYDLRTAKA